MDTNEIHFNEIASKIAKLTGVSKDTSEEFLKSFIDAVISGIEDDGYVEIPDFGNFIFNNKTGDLKFTPSLTMEGIANSAFSCFEPVILEPGFPVAENLVDSTEVINPPSMIPEEPQTENYIYSEDNQIEETEMNEKNRTNPWLFWAGLFLGLLIGFILGLVLRPIILSEHKAVIDTDAVPSILDEKVALHEEVSDNPEDKISSGNTTESVIDSQTKPGKDDTAVYDTIKEGVFLAKLSREHYDGRPEFWIYIYEENKDKIKDPENIPVGTILVIPDREKYDIDPSSCQSLAKAKNRALRFYNTGQ